MGRVFKLGLLAMAIGQAAWLFDQSTPPAIVGIEFGDVLEVPGVEASSGSPTVFLVFRAECVHCQNVAPVWSTWMAERSDIRIALVTTDSRSVGEEFAASFGWTAPVVPVSDEETRHTAQMTARTPWAWVVDGEGRLVYHGHGADLDSIEAALGRLSSGGE